MTRGVWIAAVALGVVLVAPPGDAHRPSAPVAGSADAASAGERAGVSRPGGDERTDRTDRSAPPGGAADGDGPAGDAAPADPPGEFTLAATGDVLLHSPLWRQAEADAAAAGRPGMDFAPLLAGARPVVEGADLAVCHLETPIAPAGGPYHGYPAFSVPPEIAPALARTGFDACTTASNHTYDQGAAGVDRTLAALDAAGIRHAGSARSAEEAAVITAVEVGGARVALLSYTYGFNGYEPPDGQTWRSRQIDEGSITRDSRRARAEGADVVVVSLHWGDEYTPEPNALQADLAPRLIRSPDIDLLLGHHAHVVQPVEVIGREWVVYGLGNMVARHGTPGAANEEGLAVRFTFTEGRDRWRVTRAEYAPLLMVKDRAPIRLVDVARTLAGRGPADRAVDPALRDRLTLARDRTAAVVGSRGATAHGLAPIAP